MLRWIRVHDEVSEAMEDKSGRCGYVQVNYLREQLVLLRL